MRRGIQSSGLVSAPEIPATIADLGLWLDADDGYTDKSGNSVVVTNNSTTITNSALNGHDVFSIATGDISVPRLLADDEFTIIFVLKSDGSTNKNSALVCQHTGGIDQGRFVIGPDNSSGELLKFFYNNGATQDNSSTSAAFDDTFRIVSITDNTGTSHANIDTGSNESLATSQAWTPLNEPTRFGRTGSGLNQFVGEIASIIVYLRALSDSERIQVEDFLSTRYAL